MAPSNEQGVGGVIEEIEHTGVEQGNGAVLLDISQAKGDVAANLKLSKDGHTVLVPQPSDDPNDPLNWSDRKKFLMLITLSLAAFQSDFQTAVGVPCIYAQGVEWGRTPMEITHASNLNVLMNGIGGIVWIPFVYYWGSAPVVLWTTLIGTVMLLATCLVQSFEGFYPLRVLSGFFLAGGLTVGLPFIQDMFFLHEQARKIGIWFSIYTTCVYFGPMFGFYIMAGVDNWRVAFWMTFGLNCAVMVLIVLFIDETTYRRDIPQADQPDRGTRLSRLVGIWQIRVHSSYFPSLASSSIRMLHIFLKPVIIPLYLFYFMTCMWAVGINMSSSIIFSMPVEEGGYGMSLMALGNLYWAAVISVLIGEVLGHYGNDWIANRYLKKHRGIFKPEARLPPAYLSVALMVPGLVIVGQAVQHKLSWVAVAFGWGMYVVAIMVFSPALMAYALDAYPNAPGEISAWFNFARVIGGFSVAYYQQDWGHRTGFDVSFGIQAAITGSAVILLLILQVYGERLRAKGGAFKV